MKKILATLFVVLLIFTLGICVFASEETSAPMPETSTETADPNEHAVTDESKFDKLLEGLTNSTFWTTMGMILTAVVACIATFRKNFGFITDLISKKADEKTISAALKSTSTEISETFNKKLNEVITKLSETENNEKTLITILTIFITNANINPNAKAEIMNYLTGIKDFSGKVTDIVEDATRIIEEADAAEEKVYTPALDSIIAEEKTETPMVLG